MTAADHALDVCTAPVRGCGWALCMCAWAPTACLARACPRCPGVPEAAESCRDTASMCWSNAALRAKK